MNSIRDKRLLWIFLILRTKNQIVKPQIRSILTYVIDFIDDLEIQKQLNPDIY